MKKLLSLLLCLALCLSLTACGSTAVKYKTDSGKVTITYENNGGLKRAPLFKQSGSWIDMTFNGHTWYSASVASPEMVKEYMSHTLVGKSSNLSVYLTDNPGTYHYAYLMPLEGSDGVYVVFLTDQNPAQGSYGNDFDTCITYKFKDTETVPDTADLESFEEEPYEPDFVW